jgi:DNA invertase Pin-like site-specific DNA recombinase
VTGNARKNGSYPSQRRAAQSARRQHAQELYATGLSLRQVAVRMNITYQAVHALLKRSGVTLRLRGGNQGAHSRHKG